MASALVLLVADVFQPLDDLAIEAFLNGDVGHGGGGGGAVPVFFSGGEPDDVAGVNLFDGTACALDPSAASGDDQGLSEGVGVPGGACSGLEGDGGAGNQGGVGCLKERVDADGAGEPVCGTFAGGLGADAFDFHGVILPGQGDGSLTACRYLSV